MCATSSVTGRGHEAPGPFCLSAALAAAALSPAQAQVSGRQVRIPCAPPGVLQEILAAAWGEAPQRQGLANGALVQLWHNPATGSWTVLLVLPDESSCALASGGDWMAAAAPQGDPG